MVTSYFDLVLFDVSYVEVCEVGIGLSSNSFDYVCDKWKLLGLRGFFFFFVTGVILEMRNSISVLHILTYMFHGSFWCIW